jgi:hypothetical protein
MKGHAMGTMKGHSMKGGAMAKPSAKP